MMGEGLRVNSSLWELHLVRLFVCVLYFFIVAGVLMEMLDVSRRVSAIGMHVFVQLLY